jgi:hypothetical protein
MPEFETEQQKKYKGITFCKHGLNTKLLKELGFPPCGACKQELGGKKQKKLKEKQDKG